MMSYRVALSGERVFGIIPELPGHGDRLVDRSSLVVAHGRAVLFQNPSNVLIYVCAFSVSKNEIFWMIR